MDIEKTIYTLIEGIFNIIFVFPQSMVKMILPFGSRFVLGLCFKSAKEHPLECENTRIDLDKKVEAALRNW